MLIVTYDEHGGCYDHVPPPVASEPQPPEPGQAFNFDRYGVRVPAVLCRRTCLQAPNFGRRGRCRMITSIIATLRKRFPAFGGPLTHRDAAAPDLDASSHCRLRATRSTAIDCTTVCDYAIGRCRGARRAARRQSTGARRACRELSGHAGCQFAGAFGGYAGRGEAPPPEVTTDVRSASAFVKKQVGNLFSSI